MCGKKNFKRLILSLALIFSLSFTLVSFEPQSACAESRKVTTTTYRVIKSGKTVYCSGARGIYKVKIKKGRVKSKKVIFKSSRPYGAYSSIYGMTKIGNVLYFKILSEGTPGWIYRVNTSGKGKKMLARFDENNGFAISGNSLYYDNYAWDDETDEPIQYTQIISLEGANLGRTTEIAPSQIFLNSNAKKYSVKTVQKGKYAVDYLKTPKGKFYLGKIKISN